MVDDGREHRGADRVDRVDAAQVTDDPVRPLGQVLEQYPLNLRGGEQVDRPGEGDHHAAIAHGMVDLHRDLPASLSPSSLLAGYSRSQVP
jgi:hypothetical protein